MLVSAIVLNWNNQGVIFDCLDSLLQQTYQPLEILLIDNGSSDGSLQQIEKRYPGSLTIIRNSKNLGFAEGVNIGIRHSRGAWIALLNSDAVVEKNWLEEMLKAAGRSDSIGMVACKIYLAGRDKVLDNTGEVLCRDGLNRARGRLEIDRGQYDQSDDVFCPSGCAALYRRQLLDDVGGMDKYFFAYGEDMDIGLRGRFLGYTCIYVPSAVAHHRFSFSTGKVSPLKAYFVERNRLWIVLKCFPSPHLFLSFFYTLARYFYISLGIFSNRGPASSYVKEFSFFGLFFNLVKGYFSTLYYLPHLLKGRIALKRKSKCRKEFGSWLKKYGISIKQAALNELY